LQFDKNTSEASETTFFTAQRELTKVWDGISRKHFFSWLPANFMSTIANFLAFIVFMLMTVLDGEVAAIAEKCCFELFALSPT
jgi:hypothetical protein